MAEVRTTRDDVERAIWQLTGWRGEAIVVERLLSVVDAYALDRVNVALASGTMPLASPVIATTAGVMPGTPTHLYGETIPQGSGQSPRAPKQSPLPGESGTNAVLDSARESGSGASDDQLIICRTCQEEKPAELFSVDRSTRTGRRGSCKSCDTIKRQQAKEAKQRGALVRTAGVTGFGLRTGEQGES